MSDYGTTSNSLRTSSSAPENPILSQRRLQYFNELNTNPCEPGMNCAVYSMLSVFFNWILRG